MAPTGIAYCVAALPPAHRKIEHLGLLELHLFGCGDAEPPRLDANTQDFEVAPFIALAVLAVYHDFRESRSGVANHTPDPEIVIHQIASLWSCRGCRCL